MKNLFPITLFLLLSITYTQAQWSNRYPKVDGYGHHVYLEGYELPVLNSGPMDPAPSPTNDQVVFSAKGWLWLYEPNVSKATRVTYSSGIDARPNWSPDGKQIVFVRDTGSDTQIVLLDLPSKKETVLVDSDRLELDPIFSASGKFIYYSSAKNGSFDLWKLELSTSKETLLTTSKNLERLPVPLIDEAKVIFLEKKGFSYDAIMLHDLSKNTSTHLVQENFASQAAFSLSPNDETLVYTWPDGDNYELNLLNINVPESRMLLTKGSGLPLVPKFNKEGDWVYYAEYNKEEYSELKRISVYGGEPETLNVEVWDWQTPTGTLHITSNVDGQKEAVRLSISDSNGHPVIPGRGVIHSEGQNGMVFFYSSGEVEVQAPIGELTIIATHGFETEKQVQKVKIAEGNNKVTLNLERIWDASAEGWYAADNHFHLNYGGTNKLDPEDILVDLAAEGIDIGYPLVANLGNRFLEKHLMNYENEGSPILKFGQEVRSHYFGHLNIIGTRELYWPWVWGPSYDIYGKDDRLNAEPLRFARNKGALAGYVHPVSAQDPFQEKSHQSIPKALVADGVLGEIGILEIGCLWTDEIGTASLWHEFLNLGIPIAMSAGSDVMNNFYRTMAIGATRVYVKPEGPLTEQSFLKGLKKGRSFVSNGPQMVFTVNGKEAGDVVSTKKKKVNWTLDTYSPVPYDKVEIFINGEVVWSTKSKDGNSLSYKGSVKVPEGGWVTARVTGSKSEWPVMDSYIYSESSPIWFNETGSTSPAAKVGAANKLLEILKVSEDITKQAYGDHPTPNISAHFEKARQKLMAILKDDE